ncbi:carbamoyl-phosphate synthase small subunit [Klebsiella pneumoniae]|nr:carbamoyl-phosphate synthase small subunit [Klebsiella pneumoniae]
MSPECKSALLVLEDGTQFHGRAIGATGTAVGEVVFNTSMTGYQEILTDPSYSRQIVTLTYPHIGNVGTNAADEESSQVHAQGLVIRDLPLIASNFRSTEDLSSYLKRHNIVAIADIDTWTLAGDLPEAKAESELPFHVVAYDFGAKRNILRMLVDRGCRLTVVPAKTSAADVLALNPDGIFLSNGPGDPAPCDYAIEAIEKFLETDIPVFGICLGHQLLALASGAKTIKMKFGHHGGNHPVKDIDNNVVMITAQNHGFAVDEATLPANLRVTHKSLFDGTLQGIHRTDKPAFSFQGHPEASPGPHDAAPLFDHFIELIEQYRQSAK